MKRSSEENAIKVVGEAKYIDQTMNQTMMDQTALVIQKHDITSIPEVELGIDVNDQTMFGKRGIINASNTDSKLFTIGNESETSSMIIPNNTS